MILGDQTTIEVLGPLGPGICIFSEEGFGMDGQKAAKTKEDTDTSTTTKGGKQKKTRKLKKTLQIPRKPH